MRTVIIFLAVSLYLGLAPHAATAGAKKPFTATTVQMVSNAADQYGKISVSNQGMRFEFKENGRDVVQIILPQQNIMRVLFPAENFYMEVQTPNNKAIMAGGDGSPCPKIPAMTCTKISVDKFGEMDVERWTQSMKGVQGVSTLWWEPKRKMVVRQEYPDGRIMQLSLVGNVDHYGRAAERWNISYAQPGGQVVEAYRLIDTDLGIIVQERDPSGMTRELRNLKVVAGDPAWFKVPEGFTRVEQAQTNKPAQQK